MEETHDDVECTSYAKNWCFTWNNYTAEDEAKLKALFPDTLNYIIYGHEIAPTTGTPHLQGYLQKTKKTRRKQLKKLISDKISLRVAKGSPEQNKAYCTKSDKNFVELGQPVKVGSSLQGTDGLYNNIMECETWQQVLQLRGVSNHLNYAREVWASRPIPKQEGIILREWQEFIMEKIKQEPDARTILWIYDNKGNIGKTFFAKYLMTNYDAFYCCPGKGADIYHSYNNQKIIIYDIPRSVEDTYINYGVLEKLKDGILFSGKYNSTMKYRNGNAHVIVFSNIIPDFSKYMDGRLEVYDVQNNMSRIEPIMEESNGPIKWSHQMVPSNGPINIVLPTCV